MITLMKEKSALVAIVLGLLGIGGGIAIAILATWKLGVVAGIATLLVAYLAYLTAQRMTRSEERTQRLEQQVNELETAVANQIQARLSAEELARKANLRADTAETGSNLGAKAAPAAGLAAAATTIDVSEDSTPAVPNKPASDAPSVIAGGGVVDGDKITDEETGLYAEHYFLANVEQRVSAARRHLRPVAVALIEVVKDPSSQPVEHVDAHEVTEALIETLREADTACRLDDGRYALILEDTPENGAIWTIERLRRRLADSVEVSTLWAGVSCYPAHGFDTEEILAQAEVALTSARDWPQDRIEVAEAR